VTFLKEPFSNKLNDGRHFFVFGSNLRGAHGAGAALIAKKHWGAVLGVGRGPVGASYALPTKDVRIQTLPLADVERNIKEFLLFASFHPDLTFLVTRVGCGLAGFKDEQIAPLFRGSTPNCWFSEKWMPWL
jgi:hypothetical protein